MKKDLKDKIAKHKKIRDKKFKGQPFDGVVFGQGKKEKDKDGH